MTNRKKGILLEEIVVQGFKKLFPNDKTIRRTKASGGGEHNTEISDVITPIAYIECKNHNKKDITFSWETWLKLCNEIPMNSTKVPMYVVRYQDKEDFVMMKFSDLMYLLKEE
jgi:hypothetical protein